MHERYHRRVENRSTDTEEKTLGDDENRWLEKESVSEVASKATGESAQDELILRNQIQSVR